jgi:uncharacterized protein YjbJ (UPF0337 family)
MTSDQPRDKNLQEATGRAKEATGVLKGDEDLKAEGRADQAKAHAKERLDDVKEKAEKIVDTVESKFD